MAICDRLAAPVLVGVIRPLILLPAAALGGWSVEQVEMALLHELAHIRRHDNLITLLQRLAESLLFFHPVTWWLSAWVSLERELCCDRLVVEHTGRPQAYARMLAALAGAGPGPQSMALAMARRPLTTRIRRILDMEDRSMKMTLTEGLGLLAAAIAGTAMTLAAHARPPEPVPADAARQALERLARRIVALPDGFEDDKDASELYDGKGLALVEVAQAQLKLGDRAAALATLRLLDGLAESSPPKPGAKADLRAWERFAALAESAEVRRDAGDLDGARAALDRAARQLDILDHGAVRGAIERVGKEIDAALAKTDEKTRPPPVERRGSRVHQRGVDLRDRSVHHAGRHGPGTRADPPRCSTTFGPPQGTMKTLMIAVFGGFLIKAGDPAGGRDLIEQARRAALAMPDPEARAFVLRGVVKKLSEAGELDQALALVREMTPQAQQAALAEILVEISTDDHRGAWFDPAGIAIKIGEPSAQPQGPGRGPRRPAEDRRRGAGVGRCEGAGPDPGDRRAPPGPRRRLRRRPGDGPVDPRPEAVGLPRPERRLLRRRQAGRRSPSSPGAQAEAGDRSAAAATLGEAEALARAIAAEDQKLIAQIVIAQKDVACGRRDAAKSVIAEALALALTQPEPRRSRVLTMLAEAQASGR